ncbi:hypothetical protein Pmani_020434 [Petrolisthes manimaculis]|uniref:Uncharacterized protein n=1 Tax=Petrolisthes manimaculis TaxID=1843537 RepID=A0AAE1PFQ4_9EUCA|nr:hypothetical protein Pmani_020434 [Petrolisthes manimaculis]
MPTQLRTQPQKLYISRVQDEERWFVVSENILPGLLEEDWWWCWQSWKRTGGGVGRVGGGLVVVLAEVEEDWWWFWQRWRRTGGGFSRGGGGLVVVLAEVVLACLHCESWQD